MIHPWAVPWYTYIKLEVTAFREERVMKRLVWLLPLAVLLVVASQTSAWSHRAVNESAKWTQVESQTAGERSGYHSFQKECQEAFEKIRSTVRTYVTAVVTVAKAILKVIKTVVTAVVKLVVRFAVTLVLVIAHWVLGVFLPI